MWLSTISLDNTRLNEWKIEIKTFSYIYFYFFFLFLLLFFYILCVLLLLLVWNKRRKWAREYFWRHWTVHNQERDLLKCKVRNNNKKSRKRKRRRRKTWTDVYNVSVCILPLVGYKCMKILEECDIIIMWMERF